MVVANEDAWTVAGHGRPEDLSHSEYRTVNCALIEPDVGYHSMFRIQTEDAQLLMV